MTHHPTTHRARCALFATLLLISVALVVSSAGCSDVDPDAGEAPVGGSPGVLRTGASGTSGESTNGSAVPGGSFTNPDARLSLPDRLANCPVPRQGVNSFAVPGVGNRNVRLIYDPDIAPVRSGSMVLFWHDALATPSQAFDALSRDVVDQIVAGGGVVVAPFASPFAGTRPWLRTAPSPADDDLLLTDVVVGCLIDDLNIDPSRIHSLGVGDGGLQTAILGSERSNYLASAAAFSGGFDPNLSVPVYRNPLNPLPTLIFGGGVDDVVGPTDFGTASQLWFEDMTLRGNFSAICNHNQGHVIPSGAQASVGRFFIDHPFGTDVSPWQDVLGERLPAYCEAPIVEPGVEP